MTGRKQLSHKSVNLIFNERDDFKQRLILKINREYFEGIPDSAKIKLRLTENKFSEYLDFGNLSNWHQYPKELENNFSAPTYQIRVIATDKANKGKILASTTAKTLLKKDGDNDNSIEGILKYQTHNIAPLIWKLDIRDDDYPIVYIDKSISNSKFWVSSDPVFISCIYPEIIRKIFMEIINHNLEEDWVKDWLDWAKSLYGEEKPSNGDDQEINRWVENLISNFCQKHDVINLLKKHIEQ